MMNFVRATEHGPVYSHYDISNDENYFVLESKHGQIFGSTLKDAIDSYQDYLLDFEYNQDYIDQLNLEMIKSQKEI